MQLDLYGKKRYKVNLHTHTSDTDGHLSQAEAIARYKAAGYDAVAITDHWVSKFTGEQDGMVLLAGGEYNTSYRDSAQGVYHILGIGFDRAPEGVVRDDPPQKIIDAIHKVGGYVVLAHPAWSLNTPEQILALRDVDATEIYNTVSGVHFSRRPDSSLIVDMIGSYGRYYPLIAADDAHFYDNDACVSWIMVEAEAGDAKTLMDAIRRGDYYATQGPEVHLYRDGDDFVVRCSPCSEIRYFSNSVYTKRVFYGDGITEARYQAKPEEHYLRAEVVDKDGKSAWSQIIEIC